MSSPTLFESLVSGVEEFFAPLVLATEDTPAGREQLSFVFSAIGVDLDESEIAAVQSSLSGFVPAYEAVVETDDQTPGTSLLALVELLAAVQEIVRSVETVGTALQGVDVEDVVPDLIEYLATVAVQSTTPHAYYAAVLLTVVDVGTPDTIDPEERYRMGFSPYTSATAGEASFDFARLGEFLDSPVDTLAQTYLPSSPVSDEQLAELEARVFPVLGALAAEIGVRVATSDVPSSLAPPYDRADVTYSRQLALSKAVTDATELSVTIAFASTPDGLALLVTSQGDATVDERVGGWNLAISLTGETAPSLLRPDGIDPLDPGASPEASMTTTLSKDPDPQTGSAFVLGPVDGTRLELGDVGVECELTATDAGVEVDVLASASDSSFVLDPGSADGFVSTVLPDDGFTLDFDAGVGWATGRDIYFEGGGGLDTELPVHFSLGDVLSVETLSLAAKPDPSGGSLSIPVHLAADPQVSLGPLQAVVEGIGLEAEIRFPEKNDGTLGPLDVDLGFKPPTGAGISVDASAVVGGGYLSFDAANERYSGVLQLQVGSLTLKAVGLLTTQLPDGRDGFSLLVIITGEFPPVQLGFGFSLNAVGGLLGVNRTTAIDVLRSGLRDGTTKSVLFPEDPIRNAPRIVSDLRRVFPPKGGKHVFGPMARIGWGTPTIITADIGVLLELPSPVRLVVLGRIHAALPDDDVGLIVLNMDAIGAVDFGAKTGSIDATLYDSRVVAYTLTGDMAMRTNWSDDADFALSVGGFNPRFDPPEAFPALRRITLTLGPGNPRIRWEGYFALTSNTAQAGANVSVHAAAAGFSFDGHLGFDALFQFAPFRFVVDFSAGFALKRGGTTLMSVGLSGTLAGPTPWHIKGKASFEIWPLSFSVNVDRKFGAASEPEPLPPADVYGKVRAALADERNWSAQLPKGGESVVTLRELERGEGTVLAHPLGTLSVRQTVAPLGVRIETFGNATPATYDRFSITSVLVAGEEQHADGDDVREQFAPAQYFERSDAEKLEGPSFERYAAGVSVGNRLFGHGGQSDAGQLAGASLTYETEVVDEEHAAFSVSLGRIAMPASAASALASVGAVARGPLRTTGEARFAETDGASGPTGVDGPLTVTDTKYVVARVTDLRRVALDGVPDGGTTKREAREALEDGLDAPADYRVVAAHEATGPEVQP